MILTHCKSNGKIETSTPTENHFLKYLNNMVYHICYILYVFIKPLRYYEKTSCNLLGESIFHNNIKGKNFTGKG